MKVTAKAIVNSKSEEMDDDGNVKQATVSLFPDYADGRNKEWALYTPTLSVNMSLKGNVASFCKVGDHVTITFEVDDAEEQADAEEALAASEDVEVQG